MKKSQDEISRFSQLSSICTNEFLAILIGIISGTAVNILTGGAINLITSVSIFFNAISAILVLRLMNLRQQMDRRNAVLTSLEMQKKPLERSDATLIWQLAVEFDEAWESRFFFLFRSIIATYFLGLAIILANSFLSSDSQQEQSGSNQIMLKLDSLSMQLQSAGQSHQLVLDKISKSQATTDSILNRELKMLKFHISDKRRKTARTHQ